MTTIEAPADVTMQQMRQCMAIFGLEHLWRDLISFDASPTGVTFTLIARDDQGKMYAAGNDLAKHVISMKMDQS